MSAVYPVGEADGRFSESLSHVEVQPRLLPQSRPIGFVPGSLLQTCRQVYEEARLVPFHENEFLFVSWFLLWPDGSPVLRQG